MMMVMMMIKEEHYGDVDGNSDDYEYGNDDIYIMMKCVCVCLSRKMSTSELSARGAK